MTKVILVDDHAVVREAVAALVSACNCDVVAQASNKDEALEVVKTYNPDVILLDFTLPGTSGTDLITELMEICPEAKIVMFSYWERPSIAAACYRAGAVGYIAKSDETARLCEAIDTVIAGGVYYAPALERDLLDYMLAEKSDKVGNLSPQDKQIFICLASGESIESISKKYGTTINSMHNRLTKICRMLQCERADFYRLALERGLIPPPIA